MARVAVALSCTPEVMADLERMAGSRSGEIRMAADPNVTFHFTPTRASWLNQL
ncbi:MAG TPA: IS630 family transposase, partial [Accumulibacter sp.]|nr:IS630 family transposase [Accumulibacter sp.]